MDICDRCGRPVTRDAAGKWQHASLADALFCSLVKAAPERVAARTPNGGIDCTCGHTIVEDGTCCCPAWCETCGPEDCCAEAWANWEDARTPTRRRSEAGMPDTAEPCAHRDSWVPEAIIFGGTKPARADVVCMEPDCGWQGRVPFSDLPRKEPSDA